MSGYSFGSGGPTWNGISMINGMPTGLTKVYFVDYGSGSDGNKGTDSNKPLKTIAKAYSLLTTNKNEGIALMGSSTHVLTEMLDWSKNRCHMFGYDPGGRYYGNNAKVSLTATSGATNIATLKNTGIRNSFSNIKFINSSTVAEGIYCVAEGGEYTVYDRCEIYKDTDLDVTGAAEMLMNGDSATVRNCTIGSSANAIAGAIIRPCVMLTRETITGKVARDVLFENVRMWRWAGNSANAFVWATTATDVERVMEFKDCAFITTKNSTATPAVALGGASALTNGEIIVSGTSYEKGCTALATQTGIWSACPTLAAAGGSALQAT